LAERVGIEPTSARSRTDNGFEDREEHQPPFTLLMLVLFNKINVKALC
jgi:hypothetical protein